MPGRDFPKETAEALEALERLMRHKLIGDEQARAAARLITGDDAFEFPPAASRQRRRRGHKPGSER